MTRNLKIAAAIVVALLVTFLGGLIWGGLRGRDAGRQLQAATVNYHLVDGRARVLEGRLELYSTNFGNAARAFDAAKATLATAIRDLDSQGAAEEAAELRKVSSAIDLAFQRAGRLEPGAQEPAADAVKGLDALIARRGR
jgi:hypothetical protein